MLSVPLRQTSVLQVWTFSQGSFCPPDFRGRLHTVLFVTLDLGPPPPWVHPASCQDHPPWVHPVSCQDPKLHLDTTGHRGHRLLDVVPVPQIVDVADAYTQLTSVFYSSVPNILDILSRIETLLWIYQNWILLRHPLQLRGLWGLAPSNQSILRKIDMSKSQWSHVV